MVVDHDAEKPITQAKNTIRVCSFIVCVLIVRVLMASGLFLRPQCANSTCVSSLLCLCGLCGLFGLFDLFGLCGVVDIFCLLGLFVTRHPAPGTRHPAPGTRYPAPGTRHPGTRLPELANLRVVQPKPVANTSKSQHPLGPLQSTL